MAQLKTQPIKEVKKLMQEAVKLGITTYVKWTCEGCGDIVLCDTPNALFTDGYRHSERANGKSCGHVSYPSKLGLLAMGKINIGRTK